MSVRILEHLKHVLYQSVHNSSHCFYKFNKIVHYFVQKHDKFIFAEKNSRIKIKTTHVKKITV